MDAPITNHHNSGVILPPTEKEKGIYHGVDSRYNVFDLPELGKTDETLRVLSSQALSVACMMLDSELLPQTDGSYHLNPKQKSLYSRGTLKNKEDRFALEPTPGFGSAFLIDHNLVATAAHCVCEKGTDKLWTLLNEHTLIVFDFLMESEGQHRTKFPAQTVFKTKQVALHSFKGNGKVADWAVIELDRSVPGRDPLTLDFASKVMNKTHVYMFGYPSGLPLKLTEKAKVDQDSDENFFKTDLDAFAGNSGSPVFDATTKKVIGILVSGLGDYDKTKKEYQHHTGKGYEACQRIARCPDIKTLLATNKEA